MTTRPATLDRLAAADPVDDAFLSTLVTGAERESVLDRLAASPRPRRRPSVIPPRRSRAALAGLALASAAVAVAAVLVVPAVVPPGEPGGPPAASAAELLHQAADAARGSAVVTLDGNERVYSGYVGTFGEPDDGASVYSGEWWTDSQGVTLARTRAYSAPAGRALGVEPGDADWTRPRLRQGGPEGAPMTAAALVRVPTEAAALSDYVDARAVAISRAGSADSRRLSAAIDLLTQPLASAALRGALFDLLATTPGAVVVEATDRLGRSGARVELGGGSLLVDRESATVLEVNALGVRTLVGPVVVAGERTVPAAVDLARLGRSL